MEFGTTFFIIAALVIAIWVIVELKRFRHKVFAVFLIALIIFSYISFNVMFNNRNLDFKSISGITEAGKIYFSWLGSVFGNLKTVTMNAIKMDWKDNSNSTNRQ